MLVEKISLHSEGSKLVGELRRPDGYKKGDAPLPVIVTPSGTMGLATGPTVDDYHSSLTAGGYAVLTVNYRGYGESEGERGWLDFRRELEDLLNIVTYATTRDDLDSNNIFCFGQGGTGAGNAIILGAEDKRIRAVAAQAIVADGGEWLRLGRTESQWQAFRRRVAENERRRVLGEPGEMVEPREEIFVGTPERKAELSKKVWDGQISWPFHLATANKLMQYRPIDYVARISPRPLVLFGLEDDVVVPVDRGAIPVYNKAGAPKRLVIQRSNGISHYQGFAVSRDEVCRETLACFDAARSDSDYSAVEVRVDNVAVVTS